VEAGCEGGDCNCAAEGSAVKFENESARLERALEVARLELAESPAYSDPGSNGTDDRGEEVAALKLKGAGSAWVALTEWLREGAALP